MKSLTFIIAVVIAAYTAVNVAQKTKANLENMIEKRNQAVAAQLASLE